MPAPPRPRSPGAPRRRFRFRARPDGGPRLTDRALGILLGLVIGLAIVIGFVFLGSQEAIDDPGIEGDQTERTQPAPTGPSPEALPSEP
jgi:hypothetical protein